MLAVLLLNRMTMKRRKARTQNLPKPKPKNVTIDDIMSPEVVCRTCLSTEDLEAIFLSKEHEKKRSHELKVVTGLEIKIDDGLSQKICSECILKINEVLMFRRSSKKAEIALLELVSGLKCKKRSKLRKKGSKKKKKAAKAEVINPDYDLGAGDDFQNDDYEDTNNYNDDIVLNERNAFESDFNLAKEGECENKTKIKTKVKQKRQVLPNAPPYKCSTCNKEFQMKATFKAHTRFHTNYCVCETCGKRCRNNIQLQEHKRARHGLGRIHKCAYCEYSSATKEALIIHERRHTGERPYVCDHCGATFHRRSNLVQHIAIHLPEKNFQCALCNKREKSHKLLKLHESKVHRPKRFKYLCPLCRDLFTRPGNVRQHLMRSHGVGRAQQGAIEKVEFQIHTSILEKEKNVNLGNT